MLKPIEWYAAYSRRPDFEPDAAQALAVRQLERLYDELMEWKIYRNNAWARTFGTRRPPRGMYIWGGVGRGKSLMMDALYTHIPYRRKRRVHFHDFMQGVHRELAALQGEENPLTIIAVQLARRTRLLCFDEFHVSDIADAMMLARLLEAMFVQGVVLVMTSNYAPRELYPNGLQRSRFLPAIDLIEKNLDVVQLDGGIDHRLRTLERLQVYHTPLDRAAEMQMARAFDSLSRASYTGGGHLLINGRPLHSRRRIKGLVWFEFGELCGTARSQADYLEIARDYHTVLVSGVPLMTPLQAAEARRFTWLVDIFYDQKVKLIVSAAAPPDELYTKAPSGEEFSANEFARTVSRLLEMQSKAYLGTERQRTES